jgi:PLP dependent protein
MQSPPPPGSPIFDQLVDQIRSFQAQIPPHVRIVAVTKYTEAWTLRAAYAAGIRDFGESRIADAARKKACLQDLTDVTWHLIGHLQSNKAIKAIEIFDWIQTIDSLALAQRLDRLLLTQPNLPNGGNLNFPNKILKTCLQVKLLPDPNKSGWNIPDLLADIPTLLNLQNLNIQGLMVIPPYGLTPQESATYFKRAHDLALQLAQAGLTMTVRSMGMSDDYPIAIEQGSTLIRPGRILFRPTTASQTLSPASS